MFNYLMWCSFSGVCSVVCCHIDMQNNHILGTSACPNTPKASEPVNKHCIKVSADFGRRVWSHFDCHNCMSFVWSSLRPVRKLCLDLKPLINSQHVQEQSNTLKCICSAIHCIYGTAKYTNIFYTQLKTSLRNGFLLHIYCVCRA